jgi:hypothetical protein
VAINVMLLILLLLGGIKTESFLSNDSASLIMFLYSYEVVLFTKYCYHNKIKDEMGWACSTYGR